VVRSRLFGYSIGRAVLTNNSAAVSILGSQMVGVVEAMSGTTVSCVASYSDTAALNSTCQ